MNACGEQLLQLCRQATGPVLLAAPFVKAEALRRVMEVIPDNVAIRCYTRWYPMEIVDGVSDIDVWPLLRDREAQLWLNQSLHGKYYRVGNNTLLGSANLTNRALGWAPNANLELLISAAPQESFERQLCGAAVPVDESLYERMRQAVSEIQGSVQADAPNFLMPAIGSPPDRWIPNLRHPEKLYIAYASNSDELTSAAQSSANQDLNVLGVPPGLSRDAFEALVAAQMLQFPIVAKVAKFVETTRRFGAVRDFMASLPCAEDPGFESTIAWQTLMRWFLYFLPEEFEVKVPRHSEVFLRKPK